MPRRGAMDGRPAAYDRFESAPDAVVGIDAAGVITLVNARTESLFGYSREALIGRHIREVVPDVMSDVAVRRGKGYFGARVPSPWQSGEDLVGRRRDGGSVALEVAATAVHTEDGLVVSAVLTDITRRGRLEADLHALLVTASSAATDRCGDHLVALSHVCDGGDRPSAVSKGAGTGGGGQTMDGEMTPGVSVGAMPATDGRRAVIDESDQASQLAEAEAVRVQLEAQLHMARRLESLGQLAGGVAHDFNNLLGVILNYNSFISEEVKRAAAGSEGDRWHSVADDLEQVRKAAERATELTHQLLAFGRREVAQPRALLVNEVIGAVAPLLRRTLGAHIEMNIRPDPALWPVMMDPGQLEQVLMNLVMNARNAMAHGGILTISTENTSIDEEYTAAAGPVPQGRYVQVQVSDTGTGIDGDVLDHVFEPFFTTSAKAEASGLGLATVYGIVTQAEGHVHIYSQPGLGTTVHLLLPATDQAPSAGVRLEETAGAGAAGTVLVVEDEEAMREVARRILTRHGHTVLTAANGLEAITIAEEHREEITLLLTDVVMPHMLGKEVAERVRTIRPSVRVVYMSGYAQPVLASQGTLDPGVILVGKPFSEESLVAKVREAIDADP
ncbi:MAG: ATP-binding protein [Acidimicrobiales bacterium]